MRNDQEGLGRRQELFETVNVCGERWVFSVWDDGAWDLTRDGSQVASGDGSGASLEDGVKAYVRLTRPTCVPVASPSEARTRNPRRVRLFCGIEAAPALSA